MHLCGHASQQGAVASPCRHFKLLTASVYTFSVNQQKPSNLNVTVVWLLHICHLPVVNQSFPGNSTIWQPSFDLPHLELHTINVVFQLARPLCFKSTQRPALSKWCGCGKVQMAHTVNKCSNSTPLNIGLQGLDSVDEHAIKWQEQTEKKVLFAKLTKWLFNGGKLSHLHIVIKRQLKKMNGKDLSRRRRGKIVTIMYFTLLSDKHLLRQNKNSEENFLCKTPMHVHYCNHKINCVSATNAHDCWKNSICCLWVLYILINYCNNVAWNDHTLHT